MAKELFNQNPLSTVLDRAKRFAFGAPSQDGANNILIGTAVDEIRGIAKLGVITSSYTNPTPCQNMTLKIIHIKHVSGSPKFRVGSSAGTDDLLNEIEILEDTVLAVFIPCYLLFVYPRIIGAGSLNVTLEFSNNLFD